MLYPDDKTHMVAFKRIQRTKGLREYYVGCWHTSGKKHCHIVLLLPNTRSWNSLCSQLGLSNRWCRPIGYRQDNSGEWVKDKYDTVKGAFSYLTHSNSPDKEQYSVNDLWGSPSMVSKASQAIYISMAKDITQNEALKAVKTWICSHWDEIITPFMFVSWITDSPYSKVMNNVWVRNMIDAHNQYIYAKEMRLEDQEADLDYAREIYDRRKRAALTAEYKDNLPFGASLEDFELLLDYRTK